MSTKEDDLKRGIGKRKMGSPCQIAGIYNHRRTNVGSCGTVWNDQTMAFRQATKKEHTVNPSDVGSMLNEYVNMDDENSLAVIRIEKPSDPLNAAQKETPANITRRFQQKTPEGQAQVKLAASSKNHGDSGKETKHRHGRGAYDGFMARPNHRRPRPIRTSSCPACLRRQQCRYRSGIGIQHRSP